MANLKIYIHSSIHQQCGSTGAIADDGNRAKCLKHGVAIADIEHAMRNEPLVAPDAMHSVEEQRFIAIGRTTAGRHVFVAFCWRGDRLRPISARFMHRREIERYERAQGRTEGAGDDDG